MLELIGYGTEGDFVRFASKMEPGDEIRCRLFAAGDGTQGDFFSFFLVRS